MEHYRSPLQLLHQFVIVLLEWLGTLFYLILILPILMGQIFLDRKISLSLTAGHILSSICKIVRHTISLIILHNHFDDTH